MYQEFEINLKNGILPGLKYCEEIKKKYSLFDKRNAYAMKAWVNNTIKARKKKI